MSGKMIITIEREKEKKVDLKKTIQRINMPPSSIMVQQHISHNGKSKCKFYIEQTANQLHSTLLQYELSGERLFIFKDNKNADVLFFR